jgi:hypothetical protein
VIQNSHKILKFGFLPKTIDIKFNKNKLIIPKTMELESLFWVVGHLPSFIIKFLIFRVPSFHIWKFWDLDRIGEYATEKMIISPRLKMIFALKPLKFKTSPILITETYFSCEGALLWLRPKS